MKKRCSHNSGWYVQNVWLVADDDILMILADRSRRGSRDDKAVATCNITGCGATRNLYLTAVDFKLGKIRPRQRQEEP